MKTLVLIVAFASVCNGAGVKFPTVRSSTSPDQHWGIHCVTTNEPEDACHRLLLSRVGTRNEEEIWRTGRSCDALWSADSQRLAITDWVGSNVSEIFLLEVAASKAVRLDVKDVEKILQKEELRGHCYYEALSWESRQRLAIRIFGHTDANPSHGFAYYLSVDCASGEAKLLRKEDKEPSQASEVTARKLAEPQR